MAYLAFHLAFTLPPLAALALTARLPTGVSGARAAGVTAGLALAYTLPWDAHLVARGVCAYGPGRVLATVAGVPVEEVAFFAIQTAVAGLWTLRVMRRSGHGARLPDCGEREAQVAGGWTAPRASGRHGGRWTVDGGRWTVDGGRWTVDGNQPQFSATAHGPRPHLPRSPIPAPLTVPPAPPILAIETSCDDTAAAVWMDGRLASSVVAGQRVHEAFGGVVPELASRAHEQLVIPTVEAALSEATVTLDDIGAVAVTVGPGLAGSLLVGLGVAKGIALGRRLPLVGVHHLDGHAASVYVSGAGPPVPFLCLTVSGGHTHLSVVREGLRQTVLGRTRDDAAGEAFDKVARLLGLPYPGGPHVDRLAATGDAAFLRLPSPRLAGKHGERPLFDVSFSGLKTAVRYWLDAHDDDVPVADVCASFQKTVADALVGAVRDAVRETGIRDVAIVGGVSANGGLRAAAQAAAEADGFSLHVPAPGFSVDNAAMIAVAAAFRWPASDGLDLAAQPALAL